MMKFRCILFIIFYLALKVNGQTKEPLQDLPPADSLNKPLLKVKGTFGIFYENYNLAPRPTSTSFYSQRKPWNLLRVSFQPTFTYGKFKMPVNIGFSPLRTNYGSAPFGFSTIAGFPKQSYKHWLANPANVFSANPSYKWTELMLGTQYIRLSELSTGDIGIFGYGVSLKPGNIRFKFFDGQSQQAFEPFSGFPTGSIFPTFQGIYSRRIIMTQIGLEKEGLYFAGFNIVKGKDKPASILGSTSINPHENLIVSFNAKIQNARGWYGQTEIATSFYTNNLKIGFTNPDLDYKPFLTANLSTFRDHAFQASFGRKYKNFDLGAGVKWFGPGFSTMGYNFLQNDRLDYYFNSRFDLFKRKTNVMANIGQRHASWSTSSLRTKQLLVNLNTFTQFNDNWSLNASYNNFGFQTAAIVGIKNIGSDLGINPAYVWANSKMSNLLSLSYNWSKYQEIIPSIASFNNNTHTGLILYAPSFYQKPDFSPDFSLMYFHNKTNPNSMSLLSVGSGLGWKKPKNKLSLKGQFLYNYTRIASFTNSNSVTATLSGDYKFSKKLIWNLAMTGNFNKYGAMFIFPSTNSRFTESMLRTSFNYKFGK